MGLTVPTYTSTTPGSNVSIQNAYISCRFETIVLIYNANGTYNLQSVARVFKSPTDIFTQDIVPFNITLTKDQLSEPIHTIIYTHLKTRYPGASDAL